MRSVLLSALARAASLVPSALASLLVTRVVITHWGLPTFDSYALIVSLIALLPLNDLGVGAAVTSAYAPNGSGAAHARRVLLTAVRVLTVSSLGAIAISIALIGAGAWPRLLGGASGANLACGAAVCVYALSFVPAVGQSVLLGLDRNHIAVWITSAALPLIFVFVAVASFADAPATWVTILPAVAMTCVALALATSAARVGRLQWSRLLRDVPRLRRAPGASIRAMSLPKLIISLTVPLALQSDRLVLSHVATTLDVAKYSVAVQIFAPVLALVSSAAAPLWPMWARARAGASGPRSLNAVLLGFCGTTLVLSAIVVAVADPLAHVVAGPGVDLGVLLPVAAAAAVVMQAAAFPIAMALMDPPGIRFVAACCAIALPVNVALSVLLAASRLAAAGPLLATAAVGLFIQAIPAALYARTRQELRGYFGRHRPGELPYTAEPAPLGVANLPT